MERTMVSLSDIELKNLALSPYGYGRLLNFVREGRVDTEKAIRIINQLEERPTQRMKRVFVAFTDVMLP